MSGGGRNGDGEKTGAKRRKPPRWDWEDQSLLWECGVKPDKRCKLCKRRFITNMHWHKLGICSHCAEEIYDAWRAVGWVSQRELEEIDQRVREKKKTPIPEHLRWEVFKRDGFRCRHCGAQEMLRADHIVPESKGGPTTIENLQTLCHSCNARKGPRS